MDLARVMGDICATCRAKCNSCYNNVARNQYYYYIFNRDQNVVNMNYSVSC